MIIKAIKETFGQVFHSPEAMGNWSVECNIDDKKVECSELEAPIYECGSGHFSHGYSPYVGVPAPKVLPDDEWFGSPVKSEKQMIYEEMLEVEEQIEEENRQYWMNEPKNIHEVMYEMATKNAPTTVQLDPVGGSETFQEGMGGWMSGTGFRG